MQYDMCPHCYIQLIKDSKHKTHYVLPAAMLEKKVLLFKPVFILNSHV